MMIELDLSNFPSSQSLIEHLTPAKPSECECANCAAMCARVPCLGTPEDIEKLIESGNGDVIVPTKWAVGVPYGLPLIRMFQVKNTAKGCPFFFRGLCALHAPGLKPTEGQLASCESSRGSLTEHPAVAVALTWLMPANEARILRIAETVVSEGASQ